MRKAEITKLKDGRTALAYKAENAGTWRPAPLLRSPRTAEPEVHPDGVQEACVFQADDERFVRAVGDRLLETEQLIPADWPGVPKQ